MTDNNSISGAASQAEQPIMVVIEHRPEIVLLDDKRRDQLFAHIEQEVEAFVPDMTTAKGRDECRALAAKVTVTKTKTAVDKARLQLTEDARTKIKSINESGGVIKERLEALATTARAPLTEWETVEEFRIADCKNALDMMRGAAVVPLGATTDSLKTRIDEVEAIAIGEEQWQGMLSLATDAKKVALEALRAALERVEREEADRAELARLRAEREERDRADAERAEREEWERFEEERKARKEQEAKDLEASYARQSEEAREREEQEREAAAERERAAAETAARDAEDRAREEERATAAAAAEKARLAHEEALETERKERARLEEEERQRIAAEAAAAAERARLEADQARRRMVKTEAKEAIMQAGVTEDQAQKVVLLILSGDVPRCSIDFALDPPKAEPQAEPKRETLI